MNIRPARREDLPAMLELWIEFMDYHAGLDSTYSRREGAEAQWVEYIGGKLETEDQLVLVAEDDGRLIGQTVAFVSDYPPVFRIEHYGFVQEIHVTKSHRRRGVARALYRAAERWLLDRGMDRIEVRIDEDNPLSLGFFESEGFEPHVVTKIKRFDRRNDGSPAEGN